MDFKDIQIAALNSSTTAATIMANMVTPEWDVGDVLATFGPLHSAILNHVIAEIGSHQVQGAFPGSQVQQAPQAQPQMAPQAPQQQYSQPQPNPDPFPQNAQPGFVPQIVPDHQIMGNAAPPAPVAPQGGGHKDDHLWQNWFAQPGDWYDNQFDKKNPNGPDFKSKSIPDPKNNQYKAGLWIKDAPAWAKAQLQAMGRIA